MSGQAASAGVGSPSDRFPGGDYPSEDRPPGPCKRHVVGPCHRGHVTHAATPERETQLDELTRLMREFTDERDWARFHDPKSLILALVGEVGELAELFQWVPAGDAVSAVRSGQQRVRVGEELADILLYLVRLADVLGIDLMTAARDKHAAARSRFPAEAFQGVAPPKA